MLFPIHYFEMTERINDATKEMNKYLNMKNQESLDRNTLVEALRYMKDSAFLVVCNYVKYVPISYLHEAPAQVPLTYDKDRFGKSLPKPIMELLRKNVKVHNLVKKDGEMHVEMEKKLVKGTGLWVALNSRIYVDKTGMIEYMNRVLETTDAYICNSRPRRFGKSYAANMLAKKYHQNYEKVKRWYDGYLLNEHQIYNPRAVVGVMLNGEFKSYWSETASYETIVPLINMDFDGLKSVVIEMLSGDEVKVNTATFKNDTVNIQSRDGVLMYMIHLGYLGYDQNRRTAFIPNEEIRQELTLAVENKKWSEMTAFWEKSGSLLEATLDMDEEAIADTIEKIHTQYASEIQYNDENSLSSVLTIAYLSSMQYYFKPVREFSTGRGFADFVYVPKPEYKADYPALVVELKWNKTAKTALQQISEKKYPESIAEYTGEILLVGINYDKKTKKHECVVEEYQK